MRKSRFTEEQIVSVLKEGEAYGRTILRLHFESLEERAMSKPLQPTASTPATIPSFRIRVAGVLGEEWSARAHEMTVLVDRSKPGRSFSELMGPLPDDAALMGVLESLYTHGARLLIVERIVELDNEEEGPDLIK